MYYKALIDENIVDVYDQLQYVKYDEKSKMILRCDVNDNPQGIIQRNGEKIYQVEGRPSLPGEFENVILMEFEGVETYLALVNALNENQYVKEPEDEQPGNSQDIELVREAKLKNMSRACEQIITNGFDIVLSDGVSHHFSLEMADQIMISILAGKAMAGEKQLPWHANGEACQFWSAEDIIAINTAMESLITFHQTYFNSLKMYILSLNDLTEITNINYGCEIPLEYQSDVLKVLMSNESI